MSAGGLTRVVASAVVGIALVLSQSPAAQAHEGSHRDGPASFDDQRVVEVTTGGSHSSAGLAYHQTRAKDVTATNAAIAYTSCDDCRAVALSFQVVIADGGPTSLDVGNLALALNENCTGCESVAVAYQVVLASDRRLVLSSSGKGELSDLRRDLRRLARSGQPVSQIQATAEAMMAQVTDVLSRELQVKAKVRCSHDVRTRPDRGHDHRGGSDHPDRAAA